jgi:hypothetical protein
MGRRVTTKEVNDKAVKLKSERDWISTIQGGDMFVICEGEEEHT